MAIEIFDKEQILVYFNAPVHMSNDIPVASIYRENGKIACKPLTEAPNRVRFQSKGFITLNSSYNAFFNGAICMPALNFPSRFSFPKFILPYKEITPMEKLEDAFVMAQFINEHSVFSNIGEFGDVWSYISLPLDNPIYYYNMIDSKFVSNGDGVFVGDCLNIYETKGKYMLDNKPLFEVDEADIEKACKRMVDTRYIIDVYSQLEEDECMGIEVYGDENVLLLGARANGDKIDVRLLEKIPALQIPFTTIERPPYFVLKDGRFKGISEKGEFITNIPEDGSLFQPMFDWYMRDGVEAFTLSKDMKAKVETYRSFKEKNQEHILE